MKVLIDTNVLLDYLTGREPFIEDSRAVMRLCADKKLHGYMAAHSVPNIFYILRQQMDSATRRMVIKSLFDILTLEGIDSEKVMNALENDEFIDFEDCLQEECAVSVGAERIITRNVKDFAHSRVPAVTPAGFLALFEGN